MKPGRDISPRAMIAVLVLALLASVVGGGEQPSEPQVIPVVKHAPEAATPQEDLFLEALVRQRVDRDREDLFASRNWTPPPPAPPVVAPAKATPPAPSAPPLPFKYLGRRADAEKLVVYLAKGDETYNATVGDALGNTYSVEGVSETAVQFIYLPLGTRQSLSIPPAQ